MIAEINIGYLITDICVNTTEPQWNKNKNLRTCAPSQDSDQAAYFRSLKKLSLSTFWTVKDAKFLHTDNEDWSDYAS